MMFCRAIIQRSRQFSSRGFTRTSPAVLPRVRRPPLVAPSIEYLRLRRFYSTEPAPSPQEDSRPPPQGALPKDEEALKDPSELVKELEALKKELQERTKEAKDFKSKFTRTVADFRNLQDRTEREKRAAKDFAIQGFAKDLVDSVDNFDRALSAVPEEVRTDSDKNKELVDLYNGLKMTEEILLSTLKKHGLEKIDPTGEPFDPNRHEAVFQLAVQDKEPNTVFHVQQTGFSLNGRTIRAAKVGVVSASG